MVICRKVELFFGYFVEDVTKIAGCCLNGETIMIKCLSPAAHLSSLCSVGLQPASQQVYCAFDRVSLGKASPGFGDFSKDVDLVADQDRLGAGQRLGHRNAEIFLM